MVRRALDAFTGASAFISDPPYGGPSLDGALHVDADAICPRCMGWIAPDHFVRRTLFDLVEHESCPGNLVRQSSFLSRRDEPGEP
jgi:hypothetical protein